MNDSNTVPPRPWAASPTDILSTLHVQPETGLASAEVARRVEQFGPNRLREAPTKGHWRILLDQLRSLIVALLAVAALVSFLFRDWTEGTAILAVLIANTLIGYVTELRAVRSMEALRKLGSTKAVVRRDGRTHEVDAAELVPGDIVVLDAGDSVTADLRLIAASKLQADESTLTGESLPVTKLIDALPAETPLAERRCMAFKGTFISRGSGEGVVVGTGVKTELGQITQLVEAAAETELTPLEARLRRLGRGLIYATLAITAVVAGLGIARGEEAVLMIETGIALAVAAIPEGLPIVATIALARGMMRLARSHALVRRLSAVETLGTTTVICTDKTGTLTENRMTVTQIVTNDDRWQASEGADTASETMRELLEVAALCNNASVSEDGVTGDPMEVALLHAASHLGIERAQLSQQYPEVDEHAFDPEVKMMATLHRQNGAIRVAVKGAPEAVLDACATVRSGSNDVPLDEAGKQAWHERVDAMAAQGSRVLALATKAAASPDTDPYDDLTLLGLTGLEDPPRDDVRDAIAACHCAGIRVVMVTGDQPATARKIAYDVGITESADAPVVLGKELEGLVAGSPADVERVIQARVLARVSPKQKLQLIEAHQTAGEIVAMTGDGVNDAPALEKADIGVAMGQRGTQVAREAADMILKDDAFRSIVVAVREGRVIFRNIRNFVIYLMSCNTSEVMVVGLASLVNAPLPLLPLQILFLNLVTDVFPALALGVGEGSGDAMRRPPREPGQPILARRHWLRILTYAAVITASVLAALGIALHVLDLEEAQAVTVSFLTLAFAQLWHIINMRAGGSSFVRNDITANRYVWGALILCTTLILLGVYLPGLSDALKTERIDATAWAVVLGMSLLPVLFGLAAQRFDRALNRAGQAR